ncbi:TQXA domain-containing protein [Streptomyces sp. WAC05374]|uniref:Cys-Gln thioester bond-forming surface protein n=2 Tax=Streptomyces sp. WAC05374 TaxID=2487420 RepID=UPI001054B4DA|nr:TQXA domain-containing protein [Streptomyces sp. WAC05374]TDF53873.1 TQXA domain-containing protein [Streptomyces sp. WAC05374]TDF58705.1 TQXA domain-containing protein [Streptomyces sp. WAC05374]
MGHLSRQARHSPHAPHAKGSRPEGKSVFAAFSVRRRGRRPARLLAAVVTSGLVAGGFLAGASPAVADEAPQHQGGATATLNGLTTFDQAVLRVDGERHEIPAGLFEMTVDGGGTLKTYCVDLHNPTQEKARYLETSWDQTSLGGNRDAGRIRWILQHSYPQVDDLVGLAEDAGSGPLTAATAAAGTQVAIWRYSDNAQVQALDPAAEKLADWLEKEAGSVPEPRASLSLEPSAVSGPAGTRLGPVTVRTDAGRVTVAPPADAAASGVRVTDSKGKPVTTATDGSRLYVDVPAKAADGSAALTVQATTSVPVGRAFAGATKSQTQILAGSSESTVSATATATWAASGAIPALSARKNCARSGVDVTATNKGDAPFAFELMGLTHTVQAGESRTVTVPVAEDQAYDFTITGPGGLNKTFQGILDCRTTGSAAVSLSGQQAAQPSPLSAGGTSAGPGAPDDGPDLAETGASGATPMIAGIALAMVVLGGAALVLLRKKKDPGTDD